MLEVSGLYYAHDDDKDGGGDGYKETRVEVLKAKEAAGIEGNPELFGGLSFELAKGAVIGVVGGNGIGKSSLFRILSGEINAERYKGKVQWGPTVKLGVVSQGREGLNPNRTVYEEISGGDDE